MLNIHLFFIFSILYCHCIELPSNFQKCSAKNSNFSKCLAKATEKALKMLERPIPELGLPSFSPLSHAQRIKLPGGKLILMESEYWNAEFWGYTNARILNFMINFQTKEINFDFLLDKFSIEANFHFEGAMFGEVVNATGKKKVYYKNMLNNMTANFEEYEENGKKHMKVNGKNNNVTMEKISYKYECEDKDAEAHLTKLYNDHYYTIVKDIDYVYDLYYLNIFVSTFNSVLSRVPMSDMFKDL